MDMCQMNDVEFLDEYSRARSKVSELTARMRALSDEFDRRAQTRWQRDRDPDPELVSISIQNFRENREDSARWLAVEVLLADPVAMQDDELAERLSLLQERLEQATRARYGLK